MVAEPQDIHYRPDLSVVPTPDVTPPPDSFQWKQASQELQKARDAKKGTAKIYEKFFDGVLHAEGDGDVSSDDITSRLLNNEKVLSLAGTDGQFRKMLLRKLNTEYDIASNDDYDTAVVKSSAVDIVYAKALEAGSVKEKWATVKKRESKKAFILDAIGDEPDQVAEWVTRGGSFAEDVRAVAKDVELLHGVDLLTPSQEKDEPTITGIAPILQETSVAPVEPEDLTYAAVTDSQLAGFRKRQEAFQRATTPAVAKTPQEQEAVTQSDKVLAEALQQIGTRDLQADAIAASSNASANSGSSAEDGLSLTNQTRKEEFQDTMKRNWDADGNPIRPATIAPSLVSETSASVSPVTETIAPLPSEQTSAYFTEISKKAAEAGAIVDQQAAVIDAAKASEVQRVQDAAALKVAEDQKVRLAADKDLNDFITGLKNSQKYVDPGNPQDTAAQQSAQDKQALAVAKTEADRVAAIDTSLSGIRAQADAGTSISEKMARGESVMNPATGMPYTIAEAQAQASLGVTPSELSAETRKSIDGIVASDEQKQKEEKTRKRGLAAFFSRVKSNNQLGRATIIAGTIAIGGVGIASQGESSDATQQFSNTSTGSESQLTIEGPMPSAAALADVATIVDSTNEIIAPNPDSQQVQAEEQPIIAPVAPTVVAESAVLPEPPPASAPGSLEASQPAVTESTVVAPTVPVGITEPVVTEAIVPSPSVTVPDALNAVVEVETPATRPIEVPEGSSITEADGKTQETVNGYYLADIIMQNRDAFPNAAQYSDAQLIDMAWEASQETPEGQIMNDYLVELTWEYPEGIYNLSTPDQLLAMEAKEDVERASSTADTGVNVSAEPTTEAAAGSGEPVTVAQGPEQVVGDGTQGPSGVTNTSDTLASTAPVANAGIPQAASDNPLVAAASNNESSKPLWKRLFGR